MKRTDVIAVVKRLVQTPQTQGVLLVLSDPDDYDTAIDQAIARFGRDKPNQKIVDLTIATAGFRLTIAGGLTPLLADWVDGASYLTDVWSPYEATAQGVIPNDPNNWRIVPGPGGTTILELLDHTAALGSVVRVAYAIPWVVSATLDASTTIPAGRARAFELLTAFFVLTMAANAAVRNTGTSGLPGDVIDRRSQSDQYRSRAKELLGLYGDLMGISVGGAGSDIGAASAWKDLDVPAGHPLGFLWHRSGTH